MQTTDRGARIADVFYLLMGEPAVFGLFYVPRRLIMPGNASVTASNILADQLLGWSQSSRATTSLIPSYNAIVSRALTDMNLPDADSRGSPALAHPEGHFLPKSVGSKPTAGRPKS